MVPADGFYRVASGDQESARTCPPLTMLDGPSGGLTASGVPLRAAVRGLACRLQMRWPAVLALPAAGHGPAFLQAALLLPCRRLFP
jgi:hypothetical protein